MQRLIEILAAEPGRSFGDLWDYRIAGNALELHVSADYNREAEKYRLGVIEAGKILQALELRLTNRELILQVQSFPNLNESRLVAVIRRHRFSGSGHPSAGPNGAPKSSGGAIDALCRSIADDLGLFYRKFTTHRKDSLLRFMEKNGMVNEAGRELFLLCSTFDNPFIWLKTGRWIERIRHLNNDQPSLPWLIIAAGMDQEQRLELARIADECCTAAQLLAQPVQQPVNQKWPQE